MSKTKMRCITCGKWFQSANAKEVTCPECVQKARKEKMAAKTAPATPNKTTTVPPRVVPPPPKPKQPASGSSHWLDSLQDVKVSEVEQPPARPKWPSSPAPRENRGGPERFDNRERGPSDREGSNRSPANYRERESDHRGPGTYRTGTTASISGTIGQHPRQPMEGSLGRGPRSGGPTETRPEKFGGKKGGKPAKAKVSKPPTPPKPKREKIPPPTPFVPTPEQVAQVEARYLELAVPAEYDGIRTQIAKELGIPKKAVKKIIKDLREQQSIPSWWELQTYTGSAEELEKIKALYEPYLPLPPIGVHKTIAEELSLKPSVVYQAIKLIREELKLPQYNDPALHGLEPTSVKKRESPSEEVGQVESVEGKTESEEKTEVQAEASSPTEDMSPPPIAENETTEIVAATVQDNNSPVAE